MYDLLLKLYKAACPYLLGVITSSIAKTMKVVFKCSAISLFRILTYSTTSAGVLMWLAIAKVTESVSEARSVPWSSSTINCLVNMIAYLAYAVHDCAKGLWKSGLLYEPNKPYNVFSDVLLRASKVFARFALSCNSYRNIGFVSVLAIAVYFLASSLPRNLSDFHDDITWGSTAISEE